MIYANKMSRTGTEIKPPGERAGGACTVDRMRMETPDLAQVNIEKLAALFPVCVTEARDEQGRLKKAVNFELLRQMLSGDAVEGEEAYEFTWVGKKAAVAEANRPIRKTLRPCPEESVDWDARRIYMRLDEFRSRRPIDIIARTNPILSHIQRERQLFYKGIKVISLFFINEVANYREYDGANRPANGKYAAMFEEEYEDVLSGMKPAAGDDAYLRYLQAIPAAKTHAGYFSAGGRGKMVNSKVGRRETTSDDVSAYELIMRSKELLPDRKASFCALEKRDMSAVMQGPEM